MTTLAEQIRKYINKIESAVWNEKQDFMYCYIDISTTTSAGTAIRIFPKEGRNKFFSDVTTDVEAKLGDIENIIDEAKSAEPIDKIRIIIAREYTNSIKQLNRFITCDNDNSDVISSIMKEIKELAYLIKFHDVKENPELFSVIQKYYKSEPDLNLYGLEKYLKEKYNKCAFSSDKSNLEIEKDGKIYLLSDERWRKIMAYTFSTFKHK